MNYFKSLKNFLLKYKYLQYQSHSPISGGFSERGHHGRGRGCMPGFERGATAHFLPAWLLGASSLNSSTVSLIYPARLAGAQDYGVCQRQLFMV